jgi:hypothetical protein
LLNSVILDVAIGLISTYLLLSVISSTVREGIEGWLKVRSKLLERGIKELLDDPILLKTLYEHPRISSLYRRPYAQAKAKGDLPSYIPARNFATAILDIAARGREVDSDGGTGRSGAALSMASLRPMVATIDNRPVRRVLLSAIDTANGDMAQVQANLEQWFNSAMDRVSGWYKRQTQVIIFVVALVITVAADVDSIRLANQLYRDPAARQSAVARAGALTKDAAAVETMKADQALASLDTMRLLNPWAGVRAGHGLPTLSDPGDILRHAGSSWLGWLLTALAVSVGAPFWFDLLSRVMNLRSTLKPKEEKAADANARDPARPAPSGIAQIPAPAPPVAAAMAAAAAARPVGASGSASAPASRAGRGKAAAAADFEPHEWAAGHPDGGVL